MLLLDDFWTWDFWIARKDSEYHLFFLKAPRSLGDPDLRHENARIGHAVGSDLVEWTLLDDALGPGDAGSWDDLATWTGSVFQGQDRWHMFYTGVGRQAGGAHQRIGVASSDDLLTWEKTSGPVFEIDERWYEGLKPDWASIDCRDPWVYRSAYHGDYRMLFTARAAGGEADERGVIGQARSDDLRNWTALEPLVAPQEFGHLEVPQIFHAGGHWYLSYSVYGTQHSRKRRASSPAETGTHYFVAPSEAGPWASPGTEFLVGGNGAYYAGRFERDPKGDLVFLAFLQFVDGGPFVGGLSDPMPVSIAADGRLSVQTPSVKAESLTKPRLDTRDCGLASD